MKTLKITKTFILLLILIMSATMISASDFFNNDDSLTDSDLIINEPIEEEIEEVIIEEPTEEELIEEVLIDESIIEEEVVEEELIEEVVEEEPVEEVVEEEVVEEVIIIEAADDAYEPDDTFSQATSIPIDGTIQSHTISFAGDQDWFKFNVKKDFFYKIETYTEGYNDTYLYLYDETGSNLIASNDDWEDGLSSRITFSSRVTDTYYFKITEYSSYEDNSYYSVNVIEAAPTFDDYEPDDTFSEANWISPGESQEHIISIAGDKDWIKFNATKDNKYILETEVLFEADTYIYLYDSDGTTLIKENDDGGVGLGSKIEWVANSTGTFYLLMEEFDPYMSDSGYIVSLTEEVYMDLDLKVVTPNENISVGKNNFFNVSVNVTCTGSDNCNNIQIFLDPKKTKESSDEVKVKKSNEKLLFNPSEAESFDVTIKLKDNQRLMNRVNDALNEGRSKGSIVNHPELIEDVKNNNALEINNLIRKLGSDFELKEKNLITNSISGKITKEGLENIKDESSIENIGEEKILELYLSASVPHIEAESAWNFQYLGDNITGKGQTVCVIDTGVDYTHSDFGNCGSTSNINDRSCPKVIGGYDYVNFDSNPMDDHGHGSHVAGTIASIDPIYRGVAYEANIVALKACSTYGCPESAIEASVNWCIDNSAALNISVISMSLGGGGPYSSYCNETSLEKAVNLAGSLGISVNIASGNSYRDTGVASPACTKNSLAVGASDNSDNIASFSNQGPLTDIMAPGVDIIATDYGTGNGHVAHSGTSMATPHVSGASALINQYYKLKDGEELHQEAVRNILTKYGTDIFDSRTDKYYPRVNLNKAINAPRYIGVIPEDSGSPFYTTSSNPQSVNLNSGESTILTWTVKATGDYDNYLFFAFAENPNPDLRNIDSDYFEVEIVNSVPEIFEVIISPEAPYLNTELTCSGTYYDSNGDEESGSIINWYRNGILVLENSNTLPGNHSKNDYITCEYTPKDGFDFGVSVNASTIIIGDYAPVFNSNPKTYSVVDVPFTYEANAVDPEGDNINYSLVESPLGVTIDINSGLLEWTPTSPGMYNITILASNSLETYQTFTLEVDFDGDKDGLGDKEDPLEGSSSDVTLEGISNVDVYVGNSTDLSLISNETGTKFVEIKEDNEVIISFTFDFSSNELVLNNILMNRSANSNESRFTTTGFPSGVIKTIYINNTLDNASSVCIKDVANPSLSNGSTVCESGELQVNVNSTRSGYTVTNLGNMWSISSLSHSAVKQVTSSYTAPTSTRRSGGGGGGSSSSEEEVVIECTESWMCNPWEICEGGLQARLCVDVNACGTNENRPSELQKCTLEDEITIKSNDENKDNEEDLEKVIPPEKINGTEEPELNNSNPVWKFVKDEYKQINLTLIFVSMSVALIIFRTR